MQILIIEAGSTGHRLEYIKLISSSLAKCNHRLFLLCPSSLSRNPTLDRHLYNKVVVIPFLNSINQFAFSKGFSGFSFYRLFRSLYIRFIILFTLPFLRFDRYIYPTGDDFLLPWIFHKYIPFLNPLKKSILLCFQCFNSVSTIRQEINYLTKSLSHNIKILSTNPKSSLYTDQIGIFYLPDPVITSQYASYLHPAINQPSVSSSVLSVLCIGRISMRKGISSLLKLLLNYPDNFLITLAGIHDKETISYISSFLSNNEHLIDKILIINQFIEASLYTKLLSSCDFVWVAYDQSFLGTSSVLNESIYFNSAVIARSGSVIGEFVLKYNLGVVIDSESIDSYPIDYFLRHSALSVCARDSYLEAFSVEKFSSVLIASLNN